MVIPNALHTSSIQMIGIVNSLKTGDPTVDTLLAIFVPYLLSKIMNDLQRYLRQWLNSMKKKTFRKTYDRVIVYDSNENAQTGSPYNSYLIKGILRYMHKHCELDMSTAELCLSLADQNMAQNAQQKNAALRARARRTSNNSTLDILQIAELTEKPVVGQFIPVGTFESSLVLVKLQDSSREKKKQDENDNTTSPIGRINTRRTEIHIQADRKEAIEAFVQKSYQLYLQELESYQNNDRFMYDVQPYAGNINYTAFKLGEEKTFDNLFSRQSCELLNIVDQFQVGCTLYYNNTLRVHCLLTYKTIFKRFFLLLTFLHIYIYIYTGQEGKVCHQGLPSQDRIVVVGTSWHGQDESDQGLVSLYESPYREYSIESYLYQCSVHEDVFQQSVQRQQRYSIVYQC